MTAVIGVRCPEGIILAADRLVVSVSEFEKRKEQASKIMVLHDHRIMVAGAGTHKPIQHLVDAVEDMASSAGFGMEAPADFIEQLIGKYKNRLPGHSDTGSELLVAFVAAEKHYLYKIGHDFHPAEVDDNPFFVSIGNATEYLTIFMEQMKDYLLGIPGMMSMPQGQMAVSWAMENTVAIFPHKFEGFDMKLLLKKEAGWGIVELDDDSIAEGISVASALKSHVKTLVSQEAYEGKQDVLPPVKP